MPQHRALDGNQPAPSLAYSMDIPTSAGISKRFELAVPYWSILVTRKDQARLERRYSESISQNRSWACSSTDVPLAYGAKDSDGSGCDRGSARSRLSPVQFLTLSLRGDPALSEAIDRRLGLEETHELVEDVSWVALDGTGAEGKSGC